MPDLRAFGQTSNRVRLVLKDKSTGQGKTGLSSTTAGLIISTICGNEATATAYTQAGVTIETITTLGTFATPTATKCRFKEVDATNHKGLYELQIDDARFAVANSTRLVISITDGGATILDTDYEIELTGPNNAIASNTVQFLGSPATNTDIMATLLTAPRAVDAVADNAMTLADALWCAVAKGAGQEVVSGTAYTIKTQAGTVIRTFTLDSSSAPTSRT